MTEKNEFGIFENDKFPPFEPQLRGEYPNIKAALAALKAGVAAKKMTFRYYIKRNVVVASPRHVKTKNSPLFEHDCTCCTFLGRFDGQDLYHHGGSVETTLIARWSSDGPDYTSGLVFSKPFRNAVDGKMKPANKWLAEARKRAERLGLKLTEGA